MDMDYLNDNQYWYFDVEQANDNLADNLVVIAHEIMYDAEFLIEQRGMNLDVGATQFYDVCKELLAEYKLSSDDMGGVLRIIRKEY